MTALTDTLFPNNAVITEYDDNAWNCMKSMKNYKKLGKSYKEWLEDESDGFAAKDSLLLEPIWKDISIN